MLIVRRRRVDGRNQTNVKANAYRFKSSFDPVDGIRQTLAKPCDREV
jgi:hypothetical protein